MKYAAMIVSTMPNKNGEISNFFKANALDNQKTCIETRSHSLHEYSKVFLDFLPSVQTIS